MTFVDSHFPLTELDSESKLGQHELQYFRFEFGAVAKIG
jgi:hypothetical protein